MRHQWAIEHYTVQVDRSDHLGNDGYSWRILDQHQTLRAVGSAGTEADALRACLEMLEALCEPPLPRHMPL